MLLRYISLSMTHHRLGEISLMRDPTWTRKGLRYQVEDGETFISLGKLRFVWTPAHHSALEEPYVEPCGLDAQGIGGTTES